MKRLICMLLALVLTLSVTLSLAEAAEKQTFGKYGWTRFDESETSEPYMKVFDGQTFTRVVNTQGFEVPEGETMDDNERTWYFQMLTGFTPVTMWSASGDAYDQKLNAAIASGDIPDVMKVNFDQYYKLVEADLIADLTDEMLNQNHPTIQGYYAQGNNMALDALKVDGKIYGIPLTKGAYDGSPMIWIRKDWLTALNLEAPTCIADLENIATAFMAADFDGNGEADTYGLPILTEYSSHYGGDGNVSSIFMNIGGAAPGIWQRDENGAPIWGSLMSGAKEGLKFLNDWYVKGIIPSDFALWDSETLKQRVGEDRVGIVLSPWWGPYGALSANVALNPKAEWIGMTLPAVPGENVIEPAGAAVNRIYVVSKKFADPASIVYAYDAFCGNYFGKVPSDFEFTTNYTFIPMEGSTPPGQFVAGRDTAMLAFWVNNEFDETQTEEAYDVIVERAGTEQNIHGFIEQIVTYGLPMRKAVEAGEDPRTVVLNNLNLTDSYINYLAYIEGLGNLSLSPLEGRSTIFQGNTESMEIYNNFLQQFEKEQYTKMIMGDTNGMTIDEYFDNFVSDYLAKGGAVIQAEVQEMIGIVK